MHDPSTYSRLHYDKNQAADFAALASSFGDKDFASPERSTIPLLAMLRDAPEVFAQLLARLGAPADSSLHFEYTVDCRRGRGLPSHTDVMVRSPASQLAFEFKWGEPRYETVREWFDKDPEPPNKAERLEGWLDLLRNHTDVPLAAAAFSDCVYQMLHRAASACEHAHPHLAYVLFTPKPGGNATDGDEYASDLKRLHQALGSPASFPFSLVEIETVPTERYRAIQKLKKREAGTIRAVRSALVKGDLFRFEGLRHRRIETP
jgi:hypothetical protein